MKFLFVRSTIFLTVSVGCYWLYKTYADFCDKKNTPHKEPTIISIRKQTDDKKRVTIVKLKLIRRAESNNLCSALYSTFEIANNEEVVKNKSITTYKPLLDDITYLINDSNGDYIPITVPLSRNENKGTVSEKYYRVNYSEEEIVEKKFSEEL